MDTVRDTGRDGAGEAYAPPARSSVSSREAKERTAFQKAKDALAKPLNGVSSQWDRGRVAAECDGACPVCKKVLVVLVVLVAVVVVVVVVAVGGAGGGVCVVVVVAGDVVVVVVVTVVVTVVAALTIHQRR